MKNQAYFMIFFGKCFKNLSEFFVCLNKCQLDAGTF